MHPLEIVAAAREGDLDTIRAYFEDDSDGARDVNDGCEDTVDTLLMRCAAGDGDELNLGHVEVARYLLSRGASIDEKSPQAQGQTALLIACYTSFGTVTEMVSLLLSAGADPNARNNFGRTPLNAHVMFSQTPSVDCVTALLRAGASLDRVLVNHGHEYAFEEALSPDSDDEPETREIFWPAMRALAAGVRRAGSFKSYCREPHREVLMLRGLAMRGHLMPRRRTRGTAEWTAAVAFLARLGDNGVVWNVLSFWRDAGAWGTKTV